MAKTTTTIQPTKITHILVPKHAILSEKEKQEVLKEYNISASLLPKIFITDPAIADANPKVGDVVKVDRPSYTMGKVTIYRVVVSN